MDFSRCRLFGPWRTPRRILGLIACLAMAFLPTACGFENRYEISDRGASFNDALNDYASREILLNVVRAANAYPMEFTAVSSINTSGQINSGQIGVNLPFGPGPAVKRAFSPQLSFQEGIAASWTPLETATFYQSFLNPVTAQTLVYYLQSETTFGNVVDLFVDNVVIKRKYFVLLHDWALAESAKVGYCNGKDYYAVDDVDKDYRNLKYSSYCFYIPNEYERANYFATHSADRNCNFSDLAKDRFVRTDVDPNRENDVLLFKNTIDKDKPCLFFRFQYLTQILDALYYDYRVASVDPPASGSSTSSSKSGGGNNSSGGGKNNSSSSGMNSGGGNPSGGGGPSGGSSPSNPNGSTTAAANMSYILELQLPQENRPDKEPLGQPVDRPFVKYANRLSNFYRDPAYGADGAYGNMMPRAAVPPYACRRPHEIREDLARVNHFPDSLKVQGIQSISVSNAPLLIDPPVAPSPTPQIVPDPTPKFQYAPKSATVTLTSSNPGVVIFPNHGMVDGTAVVFAPASGGGQGNNPGGQNTPGSQNSTGSQNNSTGQGNQTASAAALPPTIVAGATYYVVQPDANTFRLSGKPHYAPIATDRSKVMVTVVAQGSGSTAAATRHEVVITDASPGIVTWPTHGLAADSTVSFSAEDPLPSNVVANMTYAVIPIDTNTFEIANPPSPPPAGGHGGTVAGSTPPAVPQPIDTTTKGSGTATVVAGPTPQQETVQIVSTDPSAWTIHWQGWSRTRLGQLGADVRIVFAATSAGGLPANIQAGTAYYITDQKPITADGFAIALAPHGPPIPAQSGTFSDVAFATPPDISFVNGPNMTPDSSAKSTTGSWSQGPDAAWVKDQVNGLMPETNAVRGEVFPPPLNRADYAFPERIVFNMNEFADQSPGSLIGQISSLSDVQNALLAIRAELEGTDCDTSEMPVIALRSPEAMIRYLGAMLKPVPIKVSEGFSPDPDEARAVCPKQEPGFRPMYIKNPTRHMGDPLKLGALFMACEGDMPDPAVSVDLGNRQFHVSQPGPEEVDQSLRTIMLLRQIVALQTEGQQLQPVPIVRVLQP